MEQKIIGFGKGIHVTPSIGEEGELLECNGLYVKNGELVNVPRMKDDGVELEEGDVLMAIHKVKGDDDHYIVSRLVGGVSKMLWGKKTAGSFAYDDAIVVTLDSGESFLSVHPFGQVLVVKTDKRVFKVIWRDGGYVVLGDDVPDLNIDFRLSGSFEGYVAKDVEIEKNDNSDYLNEKLVTSQTATTDSGGLALVNFGSGNTVSKGTPYRIHIKLLGSQPCLFELLFNYSSGTWDKRICRGRKLELEYKDVAHADISNVRVRLSTIVNANGGAHPEANVQMQFYLYKYDSAKYVIKHTKENFEKVTGLANRFLYEATDNNKFANPFFVRYAWRLYDGSFINVSDPSFMQVNVGRSPFCLFPYDTELTKTKIDVIASGMHANLQYRINTSDALALKSELTKWKDLIEGLVIGVSAPIYTYNQGKVYDENKNLLDNNPTAYAESKDRDYSILVDKDDDVRQGKSKHSSTFRLYRQDMEGGTFTTNLTYNVIDLPSFDEEEKQKNLESSSTFYIVKEYEFDKLAAMIDDASGFVTIPFKDGTLKNLKALRTIDGASLNMDDVYPQEIMSYNDRVVYGNVVEHIKPCKDIQMLNGWQDMYSSSADEYDAANDPVVLKIEYGTIVKLSNDLVVNEAFSKFSSNDQGFQDLKWFFYPDSRAKSATIYKIVSAKYKQGASYYVTTEYYKADIMLTEHPLMSGAYWFDDYRSLQFEECTLTEITDRLLKGVSSSNLPPSRRRAQKQAIDAISSATDKLAALQAIDSFSADFEYANRIMQSKAANPFVFDKTLTSSVGDGRIKRLSAVTMALSQQQHGQSPVIALCSDGIWSIGVGSDGSFGARQAVSRDILSDGGGVLQIDNAIVFPTDKGVMMLGGEGTPKIISGALDGYDHEAELWLDKIAGAKMVWDDSANLVRFIMESNQLIFCTDNGQWTTDDECDVETVVASYPTSIIQRTDGSLAVYKRGYDNETIRTSSILTRETAFGNPYTKKMLMDLRVNSRYPYYTDEDDEKVRTCKVKVWVSNDKIDWYELKSLRGHSYNWYRFDIVAKMTDSNALQGLVMTTDERRTDKLKN